MVVDANWRNTFTCLEDLEALRTRRKLEKDSEGKCDKRKRGQNNHGDRNKHKTKPERLLYVFFLVTETYIQCIITCYEKDAVRDWEKIIETDSNCFLDGLKLKS